MSSNDILKLYEQVKDDLKFISTSSVRTKIMISLTQGTTKLKDLKEDLAIDSSTVLHSMKQLEEQNLIYKKGDEYFISQTGIIIGLKLIDMVKMLFTVRNNQKLLLNHEIGDIPADLLLTIGELNVSTLVESEPADIFKPHENFSRILIDSEKVRGLSPIFNLDFIEQFKLMIEDGTEIELILTPAVIKKTIGILDPASMMQLAELISRDKLKIWTLEQDIKVAFTVTDKFISLGLFSTNGQYDITKDLVSDHPDAVAWGNNLFEYYMDKAHRFKI